jgi:hypothetical protein
MKGIIESADRFQVALSPVRFKEYVGEDNRTNRQRPQRVAPYRQLALTASI